MRVGFHHGWFVIAALASLASIGCRNGEQETRLLSPHSSPNSPSVDEKVSASWTNFDDALMKLRLRLALLEQIGVPALGATVEISNGIVRLHGRAPSELAASLIEEVAAKTPGVVGVENEIEPTADAAAAVGPLEEAEQRLADALLAARARLALVRELGRSAFDLMVEAADEQLTLRGEVSGSRDLERALSAAAEVEGVQRVHNLLDLDG